MTFKKVVDRLFILLDVDKCYSKKIIKNCSETFKSKVCYLINEEVEKWSIQNDDSTLEKIVLALGEINLENFEQQFIYRLTKELKNKTHEFTLNIKNNIDNNLSSSGKIKSTSKFPSISKRNSITYANPYSEQSALKNIDNYLKHGIWKSPTLWQKIKNVEFSYWIIENINLQPKQWLHMLAKHCLQPVGLSRLIKICQPDVLSMLCQLFTETTISEFVNFQAKVITDTKVTPEKLSLAAEYYLQHQIKYTHATQQAVGLQTQNKQTPPQSVATHQHYGLIKETIKQNPATLQNRKQHKELLQSALAASTQISSIPSGNGIQSPSSQSVLPISNAGCMILWPLLPTFFRIFDLLEKNQFISLEAQREAVCLLDWLIWAKEEIPAWRLTLNKVICGLPVNDSTLCNPPAPATQIAINQWLEKTIEQLPAWKKMGINDVRHLFLQRSGEISELNSMTNIHIKPEDYDALISEWPWPINIASFSWLQQPITITWL
ncbi:hypothetical protein BDD26_0438 [Xenorhabdus cabanillasii]|uniref:Uncharacterized protein n=1 Tax=Xenorhabdus cabanillasii TaxID=351673 RepID=A0A3D9UGU4_9GAMM|nr:contractile injection system tape measure protein [Xenorhabdus cabanillasii]REF25895.1 hypothetical protein BDD26_0438 [Xenorhabdus cabanillasii]